MDFIFLRGQKRSGNHLFINWLLSLYVKSKLYNNFLNLPLEISDEEINKRIDNFFENYRSIPRAARTWELVICTEELPHHLKQHHLEKILKGIEGNVFSFYILRDPFNWMASFLRIFKVEGEINPELAYQQHKNEFWTRWLYSYYEWKATEHPINYNIFVESSEYRQFLASLLGKSFDIELDQKVLAKIATHPAVYPPSSFDQEDTPAKQMKVFERYKTSLDIFIKYGVPDEVQQIALTEWGLRL